MTSIGHYEILEVIGDGGMGTVYKARDARFDRLVAIKVLHPQLQRDPGIVERFKTEAVIQAKLNHPHIVAVYDFIADERTLAIVMEHIDGQPLDRVIQAGGGALATARAVDLIGQVLKGVGYAHTQGLVHRDLKPSNVLVRELGGEPWAKVTDFGIAKVLGTDKLRTATGAKMGTLAYMSPEHVRSPKQVDARSDIYALGATLYELLTGDVPYAAETDFGLMQQILEAPPPEVRTCRPDAPTGLGAVVARAMAKDPRERFGSCAQMLTALQAAVSDPAPDSAAPPGRQAAPPLVLATPAPVLPPRAGPPDGRFVPAQGGESNAGRVTTNAIGMAFVWVPAGEFDMGASPSDHEAFAEERPAHRVTLTRAFELGRTEVTQAQWEAVMGSNPSAFRGAARPVEQVSWTDAQQFLERLNGRRDGYRYRLPTEAEWEYAARAGTTESRYGPLNDIAWYDGNSGGGTHPVGQKQPNAWGVYDMLGNVWEWCEDWYGPSSAGATRDPGGPGSGTSRVLRGGSWNVVTRLARASYRFHVVPGDRYNVVGVRLVREVVP